MTTFDEAVKAIKQHGTQYQAALEAWPAYLGDGAGTVIGSQQRYYYCRYPSANSPAVEVLAGDCPPIDGLRVMIGYSADLPDTRKIVSWDDPKLDNSLTPIRQHATQHAYLSGDTVWVDWRQITQLKVQPYSGLLIYINGGVLPRDGIDTYINPVVVDLFDSVPTSSGQGLYALISLDSNGAVVITDGTPVTPSSALSIENVPDTPTGNFRLAAVRLVYGQTTVEEYGTRTDILDLRWPQESIAGSPYALFGTQTANTVLAGPTTGSAALPSFRALVDADLPVHDIVSAHDTSGRTAGQVLQAASATTLGWSTNTLSIAGNSTINGSLVGNITGGGTLATGGFTLTVPATGTAALGTGTTSTVARWTGTNTLGNSIIQDNGTNLGIGTAPISASLVDARPSTTITSGTYNGFNVVYSANPSGASTGVYQGLAFTAGTQSGNAQNITGSVRGVVGQAQHNGTGTLTTLTAMDIQHQLNSSGNVTTARGIRLSGVVSSTGRANTNLGIDIDTNYAVTSVNTAINIAASSAACNLKYGISVGAISGGTGANVAIETLGGQLQFTHNANSTLATFTGHSTFTASTPLMLLKRNDGNTNAVATMLGLNVNTTGTAAAGFGGAIALNLESSTTADQAAAALKWLWTDATHATRTSRADIETTGPGKCAAWGYNGIDGTARTMIANGTGDVTEGVTVQYVASEVTGADSYGGVVYLEPSDSFVINTDGTNALTLACAADGSLTVQRTAGTDTYKFQCWMVWV